MSPVDKEELASAAMAAVEPLVELLLELGVTSPEAESLLRSVFVHQARLWLCRKYPEDGFPSDARIALLTGVHRNFVRHILKDQPRIAKSRRQKHSRAERLLNAWYSDPIYLDGSGKPRDLPERGSRPSFRSLVAAYFPGAAAATMLAELKRAGAVQSLAAGRVRVRTKTLRISGINLSSVVDLGARTRSLIETLSHNLHHSGTPLFVEDTQALDVDAEQVASVREIISRRASTFLARVEHELAAVVRNSGREQNGRKTKMVLTVFLAEQ
jgi:hypothetical protein